MIFFSINQKKYNFASEFLDEFGEIKQSYNKLPLIEYCELKGYKIPHYCYHKKLSIAGNCRMCLVELKNSPKPIVSCAMSARTCLPNSEVYTNSPLVKKARENVLEFLLLNHPLDCPICDQGGECDLQDQAIFFGFTKKRFYTYKRIVTDKNLGPIVKTVRTRSSLIAQNKLKVCFASKGARFFSSNRTTAGPENHKTIKTILCDMFLKYQFTICVEPKIPLSHLIPLSLLTCIFDSFYYIAVYWISIFYIISTLYIAEKFPDSFGSRYLSFLKHHSSTEVFEKYCGNPWGALKAAIKNPEFIKVAAQNGVGKAITGTGAALVTEHTFHKAKVGQIYEYKMDQYMNGGKHSSGKPFSFKPNGPSILEKVTGRNGK